MLVFEQIEVIRIEIYLVSVMILDGFLILGFGPVLK